MLAVRRTARAEASPCGGPQLTLLGPRRLRPVAIPYSRSTEAGRTPGRNDNSRRASGGLRASREEASGPSDSTSRRSPIRAGRNNSSPPAGSATSPDELQPAAWGGGELRGSKSRRSSAQSTDPCRPHCGSAFAPPHFNFISILLSQNERNPSLGGWVRPQGVLLAASTRFSFRAPCAIHLYSAHRRNS